LTSSRVLVTGANGMLGSKLVSYFSTFCSVSAVDREASIFSGPIDSYIVDLTLETDTIKLLETVKPDILIHCAGLVNVDRCESDPDLAHHTNVEATWFLANACSAETLFVYVSTDQVYGRVHSLAENATGLTQVNQYALTKFQGEEMVRRAGSNHIVARTNIFGWNMQVGRVSSAEWIINSVRDGNDIFLFRDYIFSPIYVGLFAEILNKLIQKGFSGTINLGARDYCTKYDFGMTLLKALGMDSSSVSSKSIGDHQFLGERIPDMRMNVDKLISIGIKPPTFVESINIFIADKPHQQNEKDHF
jgi:dTDP-4-dehydrorhamnose reductase